MLSYFQPHRPTASIDDLAEAVGVPRSTAYRYLSLLRETGFVTEAGNGAYRLSPRVIHLASAARAANSYVEIAQSFMHALSDKSGETVILVERIGESAVCTGKVESQHPVRLSYQVGAGYPLHRGAAPAKVLLAYMSQKERRQYLDRSAEHEPQLRSQRERIEHELEDIKREGMARAVSEIIPDVVGVAAPVFEGGEVIAALCIAGPEYRMKPEALAMHEALLREAAQALSQELSPKIRAHGA